LKENENTVFFFFFFCVWRFRVVMDGMATMLPSQLRFLNVIKIKSIKLREVLFFSFLPFGGRNRKLGAS
jgi:hypothetical protein